MNRPQETPMIRRTLATLAAAAIAGSIAIAPAVADDAGADVRQYDGPATATILGHLDDPGTLELVAVDGLVLVDFRDENGVTDFGAEVIEAVEIGKGNVQVKVLGATGDAFWLRLDDDTQVTVHVVEEG